MKLSSRPRFVLWAKLATFGVLGVAATHTVHLFLGRDVASAAVVEAQTARGLDVARLVARQAAGAVLVEDLVSLQALVDDVASGTRVAWCFVEHDGRVLASSFPGGTPLGLIALRHGPEGKRDPVVVNNDGQQYLDVAAPILGGSAGSVRVGLDLRDVREALNDLGALLGLVAALTMAVGVLAALVVGRSIARPVNALLEAADTFDPSVSSEPVPVRGTDEFAELTTHFNLAMRRLRAAHDEHQLSLRKAASSERLVALGSLVAGVAHEVNNPLAGLKNIYVALRRGDLPKEQTREYVELMGESLGRIEAIVSRLLEFGRPRPLSLREARPAELAHDVARLVGPQVRQHHVSLVELDDGVGDLEVRADRLQVGQALLNLVLNGLFVTPKGGQLRMRLRRRPGWCGIAVEDDGPGIPVELRDRVLDPFFSTKPEGEGTGLGLTVTRSIVDAHDGELTFEFPPSGGTVVTVWLRQVAAPA